VQSSSQIITTNKPTSWFLQAGCPFRRPTNSVTGSSHWSNGWKQIQTDRHVTRRQRWLGESCGRISVWICQGGCVLRGEMYERRSWVIRVSPDPDTDRSWLAVLCGCVLRSVQACAVGELVQLSRRQFVQQSYSVNGVLYAPVCAVSWTEISETERQPDKRYHLRLIVSSLTCDVTCQSVSSTPLPH